VDPHRTAAEYCKPAPPRAPPRSPDWAGAPRSRARAPRSRARARSPAGARDDLTRSPCARRRPGVATAAATPRAARPTNEIVRTTDGLRHKRLGGGEIVVSELGLGTQRWGSADFNAPDEAECHRMLDLAVLEHGVSLIDTAEQYPIPSDRSRPEGETERIIGAWLAQDRRRRERVVLASKITGGRHVSAASIVADCEDSLRRLGTDHLDVYLLHWPARYSPQSNWGQSLEYKPGVEAYSRGRASFGEIAAAMGRLVADGKIRGWGMCNDNAYGLTASCYEARARGVPPPVAMQNDYSLLNRRVEENGQAEAAAPVHENVGFMAYNVLAGGVLTGKYLGTPAAPDDSNGESRRRSLAAPRGRMDDRAWGPTLYRYRSGPAAEATAAYAALARDAGMSLTELALRFARDRAAVTASLVGSSNLKQLDEVLRVYRKSAPLPAELAWEIDRVHMRNRLPIFASTRVGRDWYGEGEIGEPIP
jgi:aryl-alcohol dehydrogenase-like predicted oxidoreductase